MIQQRLINLIIDCIILILSSIGIFLSSAMILIIIFNLISNKTSPYRIALLLTVNMYFSLLLFFILIIDTFRITFFGHFSAQIPERVQTECYIRSYLLTVIISSLFYSNSLQAIYRLCRIIFYRHKQLRSFQIYLFAILFEWIFCFLIILPAYYFNKFEYIKQDYHCEFSSKNPVSVLTYGFLIYGIPLVITMSCYFLTLRKTHRQTNRIRRRRIQRDMIVLFRITIILVLMISFFLPATIIFVVSMFTNDILWWSSQIRWITYVISFTIITFVLAFISPQMKNLWRTCICSTEKP